MRKPTTEEQRSAFYRRHLQGESYADIAASSGVSVECVRYWCRKQRKGDGVQSRWHIPVRGALSQFDAAIPLRLAALREAHPRWGAVSLRLHLAETAGLRGKKLPSTASIGRWLHETPANRRVRKKKKAAEPPLRLSYAHQCWQIDFKVNLRLKKGETVQLHSVYDPFSGAYIGVFLYPSAPQARRVPFKDVQATLRRCFAEWLTLPSILQTDGEPVLVGKAGDDFPSPFTLWLIGLGMVHHQIHAGRPTENGGVERAHRTIHDYAIVGQEHLDRVQLAAALQLRCQELNSRYPSRAKGCGGVPPLTAHPELRHPRQAYRPEWEGFTFDLGKVDAFLATRTLERKVNKTGQITLGGQHVYYSVGRAFARQVVRVTFDPLTREWVAALPDGAEQWREIQRMPARGLAVDDLLWPDTPPRDRHPQQLRLPLEFAEQG